MDRNLQEWADLAQAFAFLGNSLLAPMSQTSDVGLDPAFWREFPCFGDARVAEAVEGCLGFAESVRNAGGVDGARGVDGAVRSVSVEYTRLFVGPPSPAAPPWETFYRNGNVSSGFGAPTFEMRGLLREAGLQISNENNQYADHMGIELLYLSVLCERAAQCGQGDQAGASACASFAAEHPLAWVRALRERVVEAFPGGYYGNLLLLVGALLEVLAAVDA